MSDDFCAVCAEPLEFVAYQKCGHKDTCSKCVARLRFVLGDRRCVICQQSNSAVFVTRFSGDYTANVPAAEFDKLKDRSRAGEFKYLAAADAYFDDEAHFQQIKELCSFSHPAAAAGPDGRPRRFSNLKELRRHLETDHGLHFCLICLEGRKVFISEQIVYTKPDLHVHQKSGDLTGPLAEAGFKGHPSCRFCRKAFYGDNELFAHMQSAHEVCFLCRRARPDKYIYYRDYAELEGHYSNEHFLCDNPMCREARFVVFASEADLKKHRLTEHNDSLSRNERRAAMQIPVNLTYRRGGEGGAPASMEMQSGGRPGITIGGAEGVTSRFRQARRGQEDRQVADAVQASLQERQQQPAALRQQVEGLQQPAAGEAARADDFPSITGGAGTSQGGAPAARWAAAAGSSGGLIQESDFPALAGQSKAERRRAAQAAANSRTLAQRLSPAARNVRIIRAADPGAAPPAATPTRASRPRLAHTASEPSQQPAAPAAPAASGSGSGPASPALGAPPTAAAPQLMWGEAQEVSAPSPTTRGFPALSAGRPAAAATAARPGRAGGGAGGGWSTAGAGAQSRAQPAARQSADAFPSLAGTPLLQPEAAPPAPSSSSRAAQDAQATGGVSEGLKVANKAFVERVQRQLSSDAFSTFRAASASFMQGELSAKQLHQRITQLGIAAVVPDMAALCPDAGKRRELLAAHRAWAGQQDSAAQAHSRGWVPPEAASAAADHAEQHGSWECPVCTLLNSPVAVACEACTAARPRGGSSSDGTASREVQQAQGALLSDSSSQGGGSGAANDKKAKPKKPPKFERLRVTGGDGLATADWMESNGVTKKRPQNAWGVGTPVTQAAARPAVPQARGAWAASSTAQRDRISGQAWSKQ